MLKLGKEILEIVGFSSFVIAAPVTFVNWLSEVNIIDGVVPVILAIVGGLYVIIKIVITLKTWKLKKNKELLIIRLREMEIERLEKELNNYIKNK